MDKEKALKIWLPVIADGVKDLPECKESLEMAIEALENQKTGHWIDDEFGTRCSCCNIHTHLDKFGRPMRLLHCSFCGAKMEGDDE